MYQSSKVFLDIITLLRSIICLFAGAPNHSLQSSKTLKWSDVVCLLWFSMFNFQMCFFQKIIRLFLPTRSYISLDGYIILGHTLRFYYMLGLVRFVHEYLFWKLNRYYVMKD